VNGLDMDKVDYLVRDSLISGVQLQQDYCQFVPLVTHHNKVSESPVKVSLDSCNASIV
jgi:HD superfamily phosphohydrolase